MLHLDEKQITPVLTSAPKAAAVGHIVVLISEPGADFVPITQRVWALAQASGEPVRLIGLCQDKTDEPAIRRTLVTMYAMLSDGRVPVNMEVVTAANWLQRVDFQLQHQDVLICWDEPGTGAWTKSFSQLLQSRVKVPLYILSAKRPEYSSRFSLAKAAGAWAGFLTIVVGFFLLQIKIYQLAGPWTITLELLSTAGEFWLLWVWNRLFQ